MYVLFALLVSLVVYVALVMRLRAAQRSPGRQVRLALVSLLVLGAALVAFNLASRAVGIDLDPGRVVSYNIPDDYLARGAWGAVAVLLYALACVSPALAWGFIRSR